MMPGILEGGEFGLCAVLVECKVGVDEFKGEFGRVGVRWHAFALAGEVGRELRNGAIVNGRAGGEKKQVGEEIIG